jgi:acyl-coenzyme A thioesterase PaaI-like protein
VASAEVRRQGEQVLVCEAGVEQDGHLLVTALATFALVQRWRVDGSRTG